MRFKRDDGTVFPDWSSSEIGNVADTCSGGTPSTSVSEYWDGPIQWLTPTEINSKYVHNSKRTITSAGLENSSAKLLPIGALLLTTRATIGACSINNFDGAVSTNQGFQSLICKSALFNEYAYYAITRDKFQKELIKHSSGSTFLEISSKNLKKLPIPIPCLEEQQKIASFFSTLDQKIELNERKLEALERLKKGVMQKIFSQEIRFKDSFGKSYPDWQEFSFKDLFEFKSSNSLSRSKLNYSNGYIKNIHYGDILLKFPTVIREDSQLIPYINNDCMHRKFDILEKGDIIFADTAEDYTLGKAIEIGTENITATAGLHTIVCKPKKHFSSGFLGYYLNSNCFHDQIVRLATGTKVYSIIKSNIVKTKLLIPASSQEQDKIAELFSSIDEKITLSNQKIKNLKELKKGFMQQMFI